MAHKTLIGGTAYEISGGKTLVNGTAYNIKNGKTLVGGTAYEVGFARDPVITITGEGSYSAYGTTQYAATVTVDGTVYHSDAEIIVPAGTTITLNVRGNTNQYVYYPGIVYLNGEQIYSGGVSGWGMAEIDYVVQGNVSIRLEKVEVQVFGATYYGEIYITEL